jgi:hypothetical protein
MKCLFITISILVSIFGFSQIDTSLKIDLLRAPVSPASNLLGIATSDIDKPTDLSAFMVSLQSATNSYTRIPSNYAIDIAPYWIKNGNKGGNITTEGFRKSTGKDVFRQSLVLSFAIKNPDSTESADISKSIYGGFGFKFSIFRGEYDSVTNNALQKIKVLQDKKLKHLQSVMSEYIESTDSAILALRQQQKDFFKGIDVNDQSPENKAKVKAIFESAEFKKVLTSLSEKLKELRESREVAETETLDKEIKEIASTFKTNRVGFTWDVNAGISAEFRDKKFNNSKVHNAGIWTNLGYTAESGHSFLFLIRYLHNPDQIFAKDNLENNIGNISTLDGGGKYAFSKSQSRFNFSMEVIYRSILSSKTIDPSWRLIANADYALFKNQKLTFSFGRNFDGTISKDGNLVAALSFLTGFGNRR